MQYLVTNAKWIYKDIVLNLEGRFHRYYEPLARSTRVEKLCLVMDVT